MLLRRLARPMLAATFIWGGIDVLRSPAGHAEKAKPVLDAFGPVERPADETMVKIDAGVKIVGGSLLALGKFPRLASMALAASLVPTTLAGHRFWEEQDPDARTAQRIHFVKNVGLVGGLLIAAADTEAKPSLGWKARRAARLASESATASATDVTTKVTGAASQTSHLATGLAAGLAGAVAQGVHSSDLPDRAHALQKMAAKRAGELQEAAAERSAAWQKRATKRRKAVQKAATKKRAELEKQAKKKAPEIIDQASRFGHDLAARASVAGSEVAHQAEGVAKDARKRLAALSS